MPLSTVDRSRLPGAVKRRRLFGFKLIRVRGRSMMPTFCDGDYALVRRLVRGRSPGTGDVVSLQRGGEARLIKRLGIRLANGRFRLSGDGAASQPSVDLGTVCIHEIEGVVVARLSGSRISLIRRQPGKAVESGQ